MKPKPIFFKLHRRLDLYARRTLTKMPYRFAPCDLSLLDGFITRIKKSGLICTLPFPERQADCLSGRLFARIDIDTQKCTERFEYVLHCLSSQNIQPGIYIRMDGLDYNPADLTDKISRCRANGLECGLHTSCYEYEHPYDVLKREISDFERLFGFPPKSFTFHGLGQSHYLKRLDVSRYLEHHMHEFGFTFSDTLLHLENYHHVFQDCHILRYKQKRFISWDFLFNRFCASFNKTSLLHIHPCYWRQA